MGGHYSSLPTCRSSHGPDSKNLDRDFVRVELVEYKESGLDFNFLNLNYPPLIIIIIINKMY